MADRRASRAPEAITPESEQSAAAPSGKSSIDALLERVVSPAARPAAEAAPRPEPARLALLRGGAWVSPDTLEVTLRPGAAPFHARVAAELDRGLVNDAIRDGQLLLAEWPEREEPTVVGVVQTRPASRLRLQAEAIELEATREILVRAGAAALRMRSGGDVELVGSRISAVSRGVMRIIGRLLRLN